MATKAKSNSIVTCVHDLITRTSTFTVLGGHTPIVLHHGRMSTECQIYAAYHGMGQRVPDAAAINAEPPPKGASPEVVARMAAERNREKWEKMVKVAEHYNSGATDWAMPKGSTGPRPLDTVTLAAVAEALGMELERVVKMVGQGAEKHGITTHAYLAKLGTGKTVVPILNRMRAEAVTEFDPDEELARAAEEAEGDE